MARISPEDDPERPGSEFQQTDGTTKYPARDPAQLRTASPDAGEPLPSVHAYRATKGKPASTRGHVRSPGCSSDEALSADDNVVHISQPHQAAYVSSRSSSSARMQHPGSTMPFFSSRGTQNGVSYPPNARAGSIKSSPYHQLKTEIDAFERDLTRSLNALFRCEDNFHPQSVSTPEDSPEYLCTRLHSLRNYMNERLYSWFELCSSGGSMEKNYDNKIYQGAHTQVKDIFKSEGRKLHIGISDLCAPNTYNASGGYCTGIDRARDIDDDGRGYSLKFAELFHDALKLMRSVKDTLPDYSKTSGFSSKFEDVEGRLVDALKLCSDPKSAASAVSENSNMGMIRSTVGATPHDYHSAQRDRLVVSSREPPGGEPASFSHYQKVVQHEPDHSTGLLLHPGTSGIYVNSHALTHIKNTIYRICDKLSRNSDQKLREELVSILSLFEGAISCPIADVNSTGNLHSTDLEEILTSQNLLATLGVPANPQIASSLHDITDRVTALSAEHMPSVLSDRSLGAVNAEELDRNLSEALASSPNSEYVSLGRDKMELFHRAWRHEVVKGSIFRSMLIQMNYAFCINLNDIFNDFDKVMDAFDRATHSLEVERSKNKKMAAEYMRQIQTNYDNLANQNLALKNKVDADNKVKDMENLEITRRLERLEVMAGNSKLAERGPDPSDRSAEGPNPRTRNLSV